ncbi:hypothetical protein ACIHJG_35455 [Streptomyces sp. NPDC052415]|uniref:hypothetical protein n=1 Tax=Streptomyces sp. NPDC052415 TaxID=3365690 RepID=UPI0037D39493
MKRRAHRIPHPAVRFRNGAAASLALVAALAACSSSDETDNRSDTNPATSAPAESAPPSADPTQAAEAEVIARYRAYWGEMERVYATASVEGTDIKKYAALAALSRPEHDAERMKKTGRVFTGSVTVNSPDAEVHLNRKVPNATITSCLDVSQWKATDKDTGDPLPLPSERLTKYITIATLERWDDGWKVIEDEPQTGKAC